MGWVSQPRALLHRHVVLGNHGEVPKAGSRYVSADPWVLNKVAEHEGVFPDTHGSLDTRPVNDHAARDGRNLVGVLQAVRNIDHAQIVSAGLKLPICFFERK